MQFCSECESIVVPAGDVWRCPSCNTERPRELTDHEKRNVERRSTATTDLERLRTTKSGSVRKDDAMEWLRQRSNPTDKELIDTIFEKPNGFTGSAYATEISNLRVTGSPEFLETIAGLFTWFLGLENEHTRLEINLQQVEDRDTGELTGNYALYLSAAERGSS